MRLCFTLAAFAALGRPVLGQYAIWDIWQTTWDRSKLYTSLKPSSPINFGSPGAIGSADIDVDDSATYQFVWGFGGSLTDSSAMLLNNLKNQNPGNYQNLMNTLFNPTDGAQAAGLTFIRVPLGASDFSAGTYSFDDSSGDTSLNNFNANAPPSYFWTVLNDIKSINQYMRIIATPWSPPGWMKDSGTMKGGNFESSMVNTYANYLLKCVQAFQSRGFTLYGVSIQNEPENSNDSYPTCRTSASLEAQVATALRSLLNNNGFSYVKIIGFDHNWDDAGGYPIQLMQQAGDAFAGVAFHCYGGSVSDQDTFHQAYPQKEIYFTECSSNLGSDWWSNIKWFMDNLWIGAIQHNSHSGLMWNLALDGNGNPKLPGTNSCGGPGCRGIVTINSDGSYGLNEEYYSMAQASRAILPRDVNGPWGKRIGVTVGGELNWALRVGAYMTGRANSSDWLRYSLVVLNWDDSASTTWNPQPVQATIEFRGTQASYTFPVGVTTLWWYAPAQGSLNVTEFDHTIYSDAGGAQEPMGMFSS